jgi:hypothetical protein
MSKDGGKSLKDSLDRIFLNLQILPYNPGNPGNNAPLWQWGQSVVTLLFNSSFIMMLERTIKIVEGEVLGPGHKKLLSAAQVEKQLRWSKPGVPPLKRSKSHQRGKPHNWCQPPPPRCHRDCAPIEGFREEDGKLGSEEEGSKNSKVNGGDREA